MKDTFRSLFESGELDRCAVLADYASMHLTKFLKKYRTSQAVCEKVLGYKPGGPKELIRRLSNGSLSRAEVMDFYARHTLRESCERFNACPAAMVEVFGHKRDAYCEVVSKLKPRGIYDERKQMRIAAAKRARDERLQARESAKFAEEYYAEAFRGCVVSGHLVSIIPI